MALFTLSHNAKGKCRLIIPFQCVNNRLNCFPTQASGADSYKINVVNALSALKVYHLSFSPHFLHPNNSLYLSGQDDELFRPSTGVQSTYPQVLAAVTNINEIVEDNIVLRLVQEKNRYISDAAKIAGNWNRADSK